MRASNFALRQQPSLLEELRAMSELEGVAVNQLINVAIAEKLAQKAVEPGGRPNVPDNVHGQI
jgi:hypothetical protein